MVIVEKQAGWLACLGQGVLFRSGDRSRADSEKLPSRQEPAFSVLIAPPGFATQEHRVALSAVDLQRRQ